jgi:tripartite-type tricarboxylate transporter receptor subunit TctC
LKARLATLGVEPMPLTPVAFAKFIHDDYEKWTNVIKTTGIKAE